MNIIYQRRSIRKYEDKEIPKEKLIQLVKAGMQAPSAHNKKPYEFIIVTEKETLNRLSETGLYCHMLKYAAAAIIVISPGDEKETPYWQADCGAVVENILLEATDLKIGSCWIGEYPNIEKSDKVKEILEIPNNYQVFATISLGYTKDQKEPNNNYYEEKIHYEKF
ncbi:MAG: nitroreductase family protein [Bacilli bacterium]|nr:nitroreductase family protein [Bacilli bacterium]